MRANMGGAWLADSGGVCSQLSFFFAVGREFFGEVAKPRAVRMSAEVTRALSVCTACAMQLWMYCQTAEPAREACAQQCCAHYGGSP